MRGRNRKGPNPLSRSYESNGPDVKVRGTAAHVAEKYVQLARDAHSSGDPVSAESYLQHAEHYFRLLMAAQQAQPQQAYPQNGNFQPRQESESDDSEEFDDDFDGGVMDRFTFRAPQQAQQPSNGNGPYYGDRNGGDGEGDGEGNDAQPRFDPPRQDQPRQDRPRQDRPRQDRPRQDQAQQDQSRQDQPRQDQPRYEGHGDQQRGERYDNRGPRPERGPRFRDRDNRDRERQPYSEQRAFEQRQQRAVAPQPAPVPEAAPAGLPAFITGGRAAPIAEQPAEEPRIVEPKIVTPAFEPEAVMAAEEPAPRPRRRRKVKEVEDASPANDQSDVTPAAE